VTTTSSVDTENIIEEGQQEKINRFFISIHFILFFIAMTDDFIDFVTVMYLLLQNIILFFINTLLKIYVIRFSDVQLSTILPMDTDATEVQIKP